MEISCTFHPIFPLAWTCSNCGFMSSIRSCNDCRSYRSPDPPCQKRVNNTHTTRGGRGGSRFDLIRIDQMMRAIMRAFVLCGLVAGLPAAALQCVSPNMPRCYSRPTRRSVKARPVHMVDGGTNENERKPWEFSRCEAARTNTNTNNEMFLFCVLLSLFCLVYTVKSLTYVRCDHVKYLS